MGMTDAARARIEEQKRTKDQWVLDPNIYLKEFPLDPWSKWIKTNNFMQQTLSRMLGYDYSNEEWVRLRMDADGRLEVSGVTTISQANMYAYDGTNYDYLRMTADRALWAKLHDREALDATVLDGVSIAAGGLATHGGLDVDEFAKMAVFVSTDQDCTVYMQGSHNNVDWFDLKSPADSDRTWNCNNEKIWFALSQTTRYLRILLYNTAASTATATAIIRGQV